MNTKIPIWIENLKILVSTPLCPSVNHTFEENLNSITILGLCLLALLSPLMTKNNNVLVVWILLFSISLVYYTAVYIKMNNTHVDNFTIIPHTRHAKKKIKVHQNEKLYTPNIKSFYTKPAQHSTVKKHVHTDVKPSIEFFKQPTISSIYSPNIIKPFDNAEFTTNKKIYSTSYTFKGHNKIPSFQHQSIQRNLDASIAPSTPIAYAVGQKAGKPGWFENTSNHRNEIVSRISQNLSRYRKNVQPSSKSVCVPRCSHLFPCNC